MPISLTDLAGAGERILAAFVTQLTALGVALPERQYRAPGSLIAWDGEQLTVCLMSIDPGEPGIAQPQTFIPPSAAHYHATWSVNLVRAIATVNADSFSAGVEVPTSVEIDADGSVLMADAAALILAAQQIHQQQLLVDPGQGMVIGPLAPVGPEGGLAASRLLISLSLS